MDIMKLDTSGFFIWQNFAVFQSENTILTDLKDFVFETMALISQILNFKKKFQLLQQVPVGRQNIKEFLSFFWFYICSVAKFG
jgi:hypothetical protein